MESLPTKNFRVGGWLVAPRLNSISQDGKTIRLEPKVMQVLVCLAAAQGDVVGKDDLIRKVWSGTFVTDDVLKRCVAELRKAFDDDPKNPSVIETIPKVGYRLVARLEVPTLAGAPAASPVRRFGVPWPVFLALAVVLVIVAVIAGAFFMRLRKTSPLKVTTLTTLSGFEGSPSFSPDGAQVAFDQVDESAAQSEIFVQSVGDERAVKLTSGPGQSRCPAWSPDGRSIAYTRTWEAKPGIQAAALALMSQLGGSHRDIFSLTPRNNCTAAWSPEGNFLAFGNKPAAAAAGIFLLSIADSSVRRLTAAPEGAEDEDPSISPDGTQVAFTRRVSYNTRDIYIVARDGTGLRRLTSLNANLGGPVWERDANRLLFWSSAKGSAWGSDLYRISASGGVPERLPIGTNDASHPTIAKGANRLAYVKSTLDVNIWKVMAPDKPPHSKLSSSSRVDVSPALSADGLRLAFVSDRDGSLAVWMSDADGSNSVRVTGLQQGGSLSWSPDGQEIAYDSRADGHGHIYVVNPFTKQARQVTSGEREDAVPSWSGDGKWIYFASMRGGPWNIWKVAANGGEPEQVTRNGAVHPLESPDGRYLYYAKPADARAVSSTFELPGVWRMPLSGGPEELVLALPDGPDGWYWTVGQKGIYFVSSGREAPAVLKVFNFASRRTTRIANLEKYPWGGPGLAVSKDGGTILYTQVDASGSDIVLVDGYR